MIMGSETEYGIMDWSLAKARSIQEFVEANHPYLPSVKSGAFLLNGALIYLDHQHNEYSTPEVEDPLALVLQELGGRSTMARAAAKSGVALLCSNVDPATGNTFGTHENYECRGQFNAQKQAELSTHLITRLPYSGAGGLDPDYPGVRAVLSPRACRFARPSTDGRNVRKPFLFVKSESLSSGARVHVNLSESLLSHSASYLKYATTALVVSCLDAGFKVGPGAFAGPAVRVLRKVNRDTSIASRFLMQDGRKLNVLEIQEVFLENVSSNIGSLPPWAPTALDRWRTVLGELKAGDARLGGKLDWLMYLKCLLALAGEYGYAISDIEDMNAAICASASGRIQGIEIGRFCEFRAAANELYIRLHILGAGSLFNRLQNEGELEHRLPEITEERIHQACGQPPAGRAANRAELIRRYGGREGFHATWDSLFDSDRRTLRIPVSASWDGNEEWEDTPASSGPERDISTSSLLRSGNCQEVLQRVTGRCPAPSGPDAWENAEIVCLAYARLGMKPEATLAMVELERLAEHRFQAVAISMSARSNLGLSVPISDMLPLIQRGESDLQGFEGDDYFVFVFQQYKARVLSVQGDLIEAERMFREMLTLPENQMRTRMVARARCFHAETLRLLGRAEEASAALMPAIDRHTTERMLGDLADHSLPMKAKLGTSEEGTEALTLAEGIQRLLGNMLGLARVLCLKARRLKIRTDFAEICSLQREVTALQGCPLAKRVIDGWEEWVGGGDAGCPDDYWGL